MKIVCISDTHNCGEQIRVPDGDLLIHSEQFFKKLIGHFSSAFCEG